MKQYLNICGSQSQVTNLEVNVDTVYVRTNIQCIETEDFTGWQYDEIQYTLREYQELIGNKATSAESDINDVATTVAYSMDDNLALAETVAYLLDEVEKLKNGGNVG